jgi:hypothetical protein
MAITPDTKNWTWVLQRACPECGYDAGSVSIRSVPEVIRENVIAWPAVLERADVRARPDEATWSPLEYAAHVRDVFRVFHGRLELMLNEDAPAFENWDQDATAIDEHYDEQDPIVVSAELSDAGEAMARAVESVPADALERTGVRSDGSAFTVVTLLQYFTHDPVHHLWDVTGERDSR